MEKAATNNSIALRNECTTETVFKRLTIGYNDENRSATDVTCHQNRPHTGGGGDVVHIY